MTDALPPSQFYTGLVAELYEPLLSERARADDYVAFLERAGTPALELCCGSGLPLVELVERGYEVEGLDASADMLARCRARAAARGVGVVLHQGEMQGFSLPRRYRAVFLAGASFTLLASDADAERTLERIHAHLEPGGSALIPLETPDVGAFRTAIGAFREAPDEAGGRLRVGVVSADASADGRGVRARLRYEWIGADGAARVVERDWLRRAFEPARIRAMLLAAGFEKVSVRTLEGGAAPEDARVFVALARRGA